jgi:two-component system, NtrC family, response regulator AtoC
LPGKPGKFEEANGGTLFLDEIGEMELSLQSKILRVLQERELNRVGGNETVKLDIRLIVATHKNLAEEVKKGQFQGRPVFPDYWHAHRNAAFKGAGK